MAEVALVAFMRIVRGPDQGVVVGDLRRQQQGGFFDFHGEVDIAFFDVLARLQFAARRVVAFAFLLFIHAVHHVVGGAARVTLEAALEQFREIAMDLSGESVKLKEP